MFCNNLAKKRLLLSRSAAGMRSLDGKAETSMVNAAKASFMGMAPCQIERGTEESVRNNPPLSSFRPLGDASCLPPIDGRLIAEGAVRLGALRHFASQLAVR